MLYSFECYCYDFVCCKLLLLMIYEINDLCMSFYLFIVLLICWYNYIKYVIEYSGIYFVL